MSPARWVKDSFLFGLLCGGASLVVVYYGMSAIRAAIVSYTGNMYVLRPPAVQLFTTIINVIFFRIIMINLNKENTAKGFLFITVIAALAYFAIFFRMNR